MNKQEVKKRIEKLREVINRHRYLYHVLDHPEISDDALDSLKNELVKLERENPEFASADSPTQRVGGVPLKEFKKVKHEARMLSMEDVFSVEDLYDWENYLIRISSEKKIEYFAEYKIDGFAISLIYENGVFFRGATRGDGKIGEDVTQNLKTIESIPLKLDIQGKLHSKEIENKITEMINRGRIEIRGEVYMDKVDFEKLNKEIAKEGEKPYANPRNLAAGSIRQLNSKIAASRPLKFLAYDIISELGQKKHSQEHEILPLLGFKTDFGKVCGGLEEAVDLWRKTAKERDKLPFQIDGIVITANDNDLFKKLGTVGKSSRGARAFKFSPRQATTKILDVKFQIGRTGAITPIAQLEPVKIEGVTITKATLHNEDEIKRLGVKIGDTVIVERAGDVIPAVAKVLSDLRGGKEKEIKFLRKCFICGTELFKPEGEAIWRCINRNCQGKKKEHFHHFVSKKAFNIDGLGPKIIDQLADEGLISSPVEIFNLKEGDLILLERFAEKSTKNLIESIEKSKKISLPRFIYSLGIRHVGEETAISLADYFKTMGNFKKVSKEDLDNISEIGEKISSSILNWLKIKENSDMIDRLLASGIIILAHKEVGGKLKGKIFVITGSLKNFTRSEAENRIRVMGGHSSNSVSRNTDYLVLGENPSQKLKKAKELGIKIISEHELRKLIL